MDFEQLPESLKKVQRSLQPYIKSRQDAAHIRRVLALHLSEHANHPESGPALRPLSLVDPDRNVEAAPHGFRGLQKEYLRCVNANLKARSEYARVSKEHRQRSISESTTTPPTDSSKTSDIANNMDAFLDLVKHRQKHERLHIIQDYIELLAQKPAAAPGHLDANLILKDVEALPKIPPEVLGNSGANTTSDGKGLRSLVDELEKSVLRAKMLLKREQKFLAKVQTENRAPSASHQGRLQALGETRNELINWIETELARAGDSPPHSENSTALRDAERRGPDYIGAQLLSIQQQYAQYAKSREALIAGAARSLEEDVIAKEDEMSHKSPTKEAHNPDGLQVMYPYLEEMVNVSMEQKAVIQQKSHITISLAKQLKEARQGLDRLADESHLLHLHPMPNPSISQRKGLEGPISFGDEISNSEKPDSSHRAKAWVFAADSAGAATKDSILQKLEEGEVVISDAQEKLLALRALFGSGPQASGDNQKVADAGQSKGFNSGDIWSAVDGNLGVINGDDLEVA